MPAAWKALYAGFSFFALAACGGETATTSASDSAVDPAAQQIAETRHEAMEEIGDNFKTIRDQMKAGTPDMAAIKTSTAFIEEKSGEVGGWFPENTSPALGVDTDALASIWEKPEEFADAVARFETAAASLNAAAQSEDMTALGAAVREIGGACKNCHDSFRADDD